MMGFLCKFILYANRIDRLPDHYTEESDLSTALQEITLKLSSVAGYLILVILDYLMDEARVRPILSGNYIQFWIRFRIPDRAMAIISRTGLR